MTHDSIDRGVGRFIHHKGARYSCMSAQDQAGPGPATPLALAVDPSYNDHSKSKSFRVQRNGAHKDSLLDPLRTGRIVTLVMESPLRMMKQRKDRTDRRSVVLTPGILFGGDPTTVLVSVIGKGSTLYAPLRKTTVAELVSSGIPAPLANALAAEMRRVMKEF